MKTLLIKAIPTLTILGFFLTLSVAFIPETAHAVPCEGLNTQGYPIPQGCDQGHPDSNTNTTAGVGLGAPADSNSSPSWWETMSCELNPFDCALRNLTAMIATIILKFVSLMTMVGGIVLNGAIFHTVVNMSKNYRDLVVIDEAWKVIRDVSNMAFIFVLLYAAIQTILGVGKDVKGLIVRIIVVAILINFSLFFTQFIIDISNVLTLTFYDAMVPNAAENGLYGAGLSDAFMNHLNLTNIYSMEGQSTVTFLGIVTTGIMGSILLLISCFVFFAVALMFIIRYVVLIMVLILSPIAFIAHILPSGTDAEKYRKQWWDALIGQAFFAPVYMMLTWVTLQILDGVTGAFKVITSVTQTNLSGTGQAALTTAGNLNNAQGLLSIFINFIVVIAFLIFSLVIAKELANRAPGGVSKLTSWATGAAGSATLGMAGRFGRGSLGRVGQQVADSKYLKDKPNSMMARLALASGRKTAGASFDMRSAGFAGQLDAGKGQKGGFAKDMEEKLKAEKKYADEFKPSDLLLANAEKKFEAIKKTGSISEVANAQKELDELKGASAEDLRNRKIKELMARNNWTKNQAKNELGQLEARRLKRMNDLRSSGLSEEKAKEQMKTESEAVAGWEAEAVKSTANIRKEGYAKDRENPARFSLTGRVGFIGKTKKERLTIAAAVRKSIKEKKAAEKIAEEIGKQAESAADDAGGTSTPPSEPSGGDTAPPPSTSTT